MIKAKNNNGFTLIELLVSIAIITILSGVVLTSMSIHRQKARDARRVSELQSINDAVNLFFAENGRLPGDIYPENFDDSVHTPEHEYEKHYIENIFSGAVPRDPATGNQYIYHRYYNLDGRGKYCIGAQMEYLDPTGPCDDPAAPTAQYVLQGPQ